MPKESPAPRELFNSFWLAGFECSTHRTLAGVRLDMLAVTEHDRQVDHDYALLGPMNIKTARDGIRWHLIERAGKFDFSSFAPMVEAAQRHDIQVIWDICHYGWPDDLDASTPAFVDRFARFCKAVARFLAEHTDAIPYYTPINEISFLSWAMGRMMQANLRQPGELKRNLVRATIAGCEALWEIDPRARISHVDPLVNVMPPRNRPDLVENAYWQHMSQYETWDMLTGRSAPELGGDPRYLDIFGINYYHSNQWEHPDGRLRWEDTPIDSRWIPFHQLLHNIYLRYGRPLYVAETSHFGVGRARWIKEIAEEVHLACAQGVPVHGICIYPILDRPDWDDPNHWHNSGLWDLLPDENGHLRRVINEEYARQLSISQQLLTEQHCG
ncbi:MAG TPA: beta-glucosidase [Gammaproteobacteria bacterium]|nr:beta-glucosidase [Gammaproteobacteria bacterium]